MTCYLASAVVPIIQASKFASFITQDNKHYKFATLNIVMTLLSQTSRLAGRSITFSICLFICPFICYQTCDILISDTVIFWK